MSTVYTIQADGSTEPMTRVRCKNEDLELQLILEKNHDLLPGDQISPEDPCRWLLIKREMPVPDPSTGVDRWSIDFVFADQYAVPTFVECKRFEDTRSRREVVGQMFEYAANGHYYWTKDMLQDYADQSAQRKGTNLDDAVRALQPAECSSTSEYFEKVQQNLREGQVRIVFFLEESPMELRSVVDFLNKQMERSEVLLVEARQYSQNGSKIVVPTLFGYTEEARQVKRTVTVTTASSRKKWDKALFFSDAQQKLKPGEVQTLEHFHDRCSELGFEIGWGTGKDNGTFTIKKTSIFKRSLLQVVSNGNLYLNFQWLNENEAEEKARVRFKDLVVQNSSLLIPEDYADKFPTYRINEWGDKADQIINALKQLLTDYRGVSA